MGAGLTSPTLIRCDGTRRSLLRTGFVPRLFFHLHECGEATWDEEGSIVHDLETAREGALKSAREIMCAEIREGRLCLSCRIDIADADGKVLLVIPFTDAVKVSGL